ncbi:MAG: thioredoxin-dependent thiol peroxidase [bacterium]
MNTKLQSGDPAPDFTLTAVGGTHGSGAPVRLSSLRGQIVVLYFYPKDDTPGCTAQACDLRDHYAAFVAKGALVFGVSVDSPESHSKFLAKHALPFPLLSDESREVVQAYAVWVEKSMYGKKYMGTERSTFVIAADGTIQSIHRKIQPAAHVDTILKNL